MGSGVSKETLSKETATEKRKMAAGPRVSLNTAPWDAKDGPDPDKAPRSEVVDCLTEFYQKHDPQKATTIDAQIEQFGSNLAGLFRSLKIEYNCELPRLKETPETHSPKAETKTPIGETKSESGTAKHASLEAKNSSETKSGEPEAKPVSSGPPSKGPPTRKAVGWDKAAANLNTKSKSREEKTDEIDDSGNKSPKKSSNQSPKSAEEKQDDREDFPEKDKEGKHSDGEDDGEGIGELNNLRRVPSAVSTASAMSDSGRSGGDGDSDVEFIEDRSQASVVAGSRRSPRIQTRNSVVVGLDGGDLNFRIREPTHNAKQRMQLLLELARDVEQFEKPEEVEECKPSKTKSGDDITTWPDGTQYQVSPSGMTVLVFPDGRVVQRNGDRMIMKRPNGTLVQRSKCGVAEPGGYIINQKTKDGLQCQLNNDGFQEHFEGGGYIQVTNSDPSKFTMEQFLDDPAERGRIEEHTAEYHLVIDRNNGHAFETRNDGTQLNTYEKEGVSLIIYKDGLEIQLNKDGHTLQKSPDGTITQQNPDGSVIEAYFDGSKVHYKTDGTIVEEVPGEYIRLTQPDGTVRMSFPDSTFTMRRPDGAFFRYNINGEILQHLQKDGTPVENGDKALMEQKEMTGTMKVNPRPHGDNDLPEVTPAMMQQTNHVLGEIVATEATFVSELEWITARFCGDATPEGLDPFTCADLTPGISEILEASQQFLLSLREPVEAYGSQHRHYPTLQAVGKTICHFIGLFRGPYGRNLRNFAHAAQLCQEQNAKKLPQSTKSSVMQLNNKLILPVQRCMRYYMLLQQLLTAAAIRLDNANPEVADIIKAFKACKSFATYCNTEELQGQSQLLIKEAPKLHSHIGGKKLMLQIDVCKASKNATPVCLHLYNNGLLVQRTDAGEIKAFNVCAPKSTTQENFRSQKKPPSLEMVSGTVYPKSSNKVSKRGWMLRSSKRAMLSHDLQVRELEKLHHLITQLVNNALLEASIKAMEVPEEHRQGYEHIMQFKKACEEDLAHGFISDKEYNRMLKKVVEEQTAVSGKGATIEIPIAVVEKPKEFELRKYGRDLDLTANFEGDLDAAKDAIRHGRFPIPVSGAYVLDKDTGIYSHIIAAWTAGNL